MKRAVLLFLLLAMIAVSAGAAYRIQLTSGKVITADDKPVIKEDMAYFTRSGIYFYIPAAQMDVPASERLNALEAASSVAPGGAAPASPAAPVFVGEEQLDVIRARSRLANEGELTTPPPEAQAPAGGGATAPAPAAKSTSQAKQRGQLQDQLSGLLEKQSGYVKEFNSLQNQLTALKDSYNTSAQQNDKERIQQQIDTLSSQAEQVQGNVTSTQGQIQTLQQQLSSTPVVVESDVPPPKEGEGAPVEK
jgi:hypothetical protein